MLRLPQQIGYHHFGVSGFVGDNENFCGSGEKVDPDTPEKLALGFRHICVPWPDEHVDWLDSFRTDGHRCDRLDAAQNVDRIGTAHRHRGDRFGVRLPLGGRRTGDDPLHAGYLSSDNAHVGRGHHRVATTGYVAPDAVDGDMPLPELYARQCLHLDVLECAFLDLGEMPDLLLGELDSLDCLIRNRIHELVDFRLRQAEAFGRPVVKPL